MAEKEETRRFSNITLPSVIADRYKLVKIIGQGGVADVYEGMCEISSSHPYAPGSRLEAELYLLVLGQIE
jgi:hypothetical protein